VFKVSSSPVKYERRVPDGSFEEYGQADGAGHVPTQGLPDEGRGPQGNAGDVHVRREPEARAVSDATGLVTTLSYEHPTDTLK